MMHDMKEVKKLDAFTKEMNKLAYEHGVILTVSNVELFDPADDVGDQVEQYVLLPSVRRDENANWVLDEAMTEIVWSGDVSEG